MAALALALAAQGQARAADRPELWFAPPDDVTQHGADFHALFAHPEQWRAAARGVSVFTIPVGYLLHTPTGVVRRELAVLRGLGIRLDVSVAVVGTDKKLCGDGVEGMIWPGESALYARQLKALGIAIDSFSLDLPLTDGHILRRVQKPAACELPVRETAIRTARSVRDFLAQFPDAAVIDLEVPTGIPLAQWTATLQEWLTEYKAASGRDFDGLTMDAWWKFPWADAVRATARILADRHVRSGIFIDESAGADLSGPAWVTAAGAHARAMEAAGIALDYAVIADWENMNVRSLPESDPGTLTGLLRELARRPATARCPAAPRAGCPSADGRR